MFYRVASHEIEALQCEGYAQFSVISSARVLLGHASCSIYRKNHSPL